MRACFATALVSYLKETWRRHATQSVFVENFVKRISDAKSFIWNLFENSVNKSDGIMVCRKLSTACAVIFLMK